MLQFLSESHVQSNSVILGALFLQQY